LNAVAEARKKTIEIYGKEQVLGTEHNQAVKQTAWKKGHCYNCGAMVWPDGAEFDYTP
jgi:hypothetical protein